MMASEAKQKRPRSIQEIAPPRKPSSVTAQATVPTHSEENATRIHQRGPFHSRASSKAKAKGMRKRTMLWRNATQPVFMKLALARLAPAYEARATGGVIMERTQ